MARIFQESDFLPDETQSTPATQATRRFTDADFADAQTLPNYANGLDERRPINTSPLTVEDRAKLSVGNEAGKLKYLKQRFGDVKRAKNGDLLVKNSDGLWYRTDPEGLGSGDAREQTKEILADAADLIPEVTQIGSQIGAAAGLALATGGTSLAAQAGTSAAVGGAVSAGLTSLGRLVGTYDATPEEQLKDVALETALNFGGTYVAAGVKPAVGLVAKGLKNFANVANVNAGTRQVLADTLGTMQGVGPKAYETLFDYSDDVVNTLKKASLGASNSDAIMQRLAQENVELARGIAQSARPTLTSFYDDLSKEVIENVDEGFTSNIKEVTKNVLTQAQQLGLGKFNEAGKFIMASQDDFLKLAQETGELSALAADKQSLDILTDAVQSLSKFGEAKELSGKMGAMQLLKFKKVIGDTTYRLKEAADDAALAPAQTLLSRLNQAVEDSVASKFQLKTPITSKITGQQVDNLLSHLNISYSEASKTLAPLMRVSAQAAKSGSNQPFESLANQLISSSGRNQTQKTATDALVDVLAKKGGAGGAAIAQNYKQLQVNQAAAAFSPWLRKGIMSQGATSGAVGAGIATADPAIALGLATTSAAMSPRLGMLAVNAAMKGKQFVAGLTPAQLKNLTSNPQLLQAWSQSVLAGPEVATQMSNQLGQQVIQGVMGNGQ